MNDASAQENRDTSAQGKNERDGRVDEPTLGFDLEPVALKSAAYRVLARKYRPTRFEDLIGQEPMVRTLANSFASQRIHQAYILTGVRGVGKTTTARILARAFNYSLPGRIDKPSIDMPELGVHCQAIIESRHVDVIEMDAASHTGIDDVREIIENARYRPISARNKVYIIDEVHMLSKAAFNGLLKTLEEPPEHVKFLFATTEIEKVPITVRSRCLRFDLKRIEAGLMTRHLSAICKAEDVAYEPDALPLISRVAEGSVRDALSLLDQAIAHGAEGGVQTAGIRAMLGLSDRAHIVDLFELAMKGEIAPALALIGRLFQDGADPAQVLIELAEFGHFVTRLKLAPNGVDDPAVGEDERARGGEFARKLGLGALTRAWQILLKGVQDIKDSPRPLASAEMALIRLGYAADLPSPEDALRRLAETDATPASAPALQSPPTRGPTGGGALRAVARVAPAPDLPPVAAPASPVAAPAVRLARFEDVVALARAKRDIQLQAALENEVRLARFEAGSISFTLVPGASSQIAQTLSRRLQEWTGERWMVGLVAGATTPTLRESASAREAERLSGVAANPLVRKIMTRFPGAQIVEVRGLEPSSAADPAPAGDDEVAYADAVIVEDDV
jgi:DNA polymerase III subunit gamma/tau